MSLSTDRELIGRSAWALANQVFQIALSLASVAVIARLLGPEPYGLYALVLLIVGGAEVLMGGHVSDYLVQKREIDRQDQDTAFWLSMVIGLIIGVALLAASPLVGGLLGRPELAALIPVAAGLVVITAATGTPTNLLVREMDFKAMAKIDAVTGTGSLIVGVVLALAGFEVWSLLIMELVRRVSRLVAMSWSLRWVPGFHARADRLSDLWRFARPRLSGTFLQYVGQATPRLVVESMLGVQALGYFAIASRLLDQMTGLMTGPLAAVAFPAAARSRDDLPNLRRLLGRAIATSTAIGWPAILGFVVVAPVLIPLALGQEWSPVITVVQILMLSSLRASVTGFNNAVILGLGRPDLRMRLSLLHALVGLVLCPVGAVLWGLEGVAVAMVVRALILWPTSARYVHRLTEFDVLRQLRIAMVGAVPAILMATLIAVLEWCLPHAMHAGLRLSLLVATGAVAYVALWAAFNPASARLGVDFIRARLVARAG